MRTRKGIYKTRSKRGKRLNTRKGLKHRRKRTFKKLKGGGWFPTISWSKKVDAEPSALKILGDGADKSLKTTARTVSKTMDLVTKTAERSVELTGASVNLGLNITRGTVDTTNLTFLAVNKVLQKCLNLIIKGFEESYTQISQCETHNYGNDGACVNRCIKKIMKKFKKKFHERRPIEYTNLKKSIEVTKTLIDKSIDYFCKRGYLYGRYCDDKYKKSHEEEEATYSILMSKVDNEINEESAYAENTYNKIYLATDCNSIKPLCFEYIDRLCTPFQRADAINKYMENHETLLLEWSKKIEEYKQKADFEDFFKNFGMKVTNYDKEKRIKQQKREEASKIEKIVGLLKKNSNIEMYEMEIILIEKNNEINQEITESKVDISRLEGLIIEINEKLKNIPPDQQKKLDEQKIILNRNLEQEQKDLDALTIEFEKTTLQINKIIERENEIVTKTGGVITHINVIDRLKENIRTIEKKQQEEEDAAAAEVMKANLELTAANNPLSGENATKFIEQAANASANTATKASANAATKASANTATKASANAATKASANAATKASANAATKASANAATKASANAATKASANAAAKASANAATKASANAAAKASANAAAKASANAAAKASANAATKASANAATKASANAATKAAKPDPLLKTNGQVSGNNANSKKPGTFSPLLKPST